jgi:hypothetical protein
MAKRPWPNFRYPVGICLKSLMETTINPNNVVDLWANILSQVLPLATSPQVRNIRHCHIIMKTQLLSWMHKDSRIALSGTVTCSHRLPKDLLYCLSSRTSKHRARIHDAYFTEYTEASSNYKLIIILFKESRHPTVCRPVSYSQGTVIKFLLGGQLS